MGIKDTKIDTRERVVEYNNRYLEELISGGHMMTGELFSVVGVGTDGVKVRYVANITNGIIRRYKIDDLERLLGVEHEHGDRTKSRHRDGRMIVELVVPYDKYVHVNTSADNIYIDENGEVIGVQWTCYISHFMSKVGQRLDYLNGLTSHSGDIDSGATYVTNHMNGCKLDNSIANLERCTTVENGLHGTILASCKYYDMKNRLATTSNKAHTFTHLDRRISVRQVAEYMYYNPEFRDSVYDCYRSIINGRRGKRYIKELCLNQFYMFLEEEY